MSSGHDAPGSNSGDFTAATHQPHALTNNQLKSRLYATPEVLNNSRPRFKVLHRQSTTSHEVKIMPNSHLHCVHEMGLYQHVYTIEIL